MIKTYGKGEPGDLVRPILHHAPGLEDVAFAVLAGLWAHELHTDQDREHEMHIGTGASDWNLYLDTGECFAFRGRPASSGSDYDAVLVHTGSVRPLGPVALTMEKPEDTAKLWALLSRALAGQPVAAAP